MLPLTFLLARTLRSLVAWNLRGSSGCRVALKNRYLDISVILVEANTVPYFCFYRIALLKSCKQILPSKSHSREICESLATISAVAGSSNLMARNAVDQ